MAIHSPSSPSPSPERSKKLELVDANANRRVVSWEMPEKIKTLGAGTRGTVAEILIDGERKAIKMYEKAVTARDAMLGYKDLIQEAPEEEKGRIVPMEINESNNAIIMPLLNENAWVVSMGKNTSADREALAKNKIKSIPNFGDFVANFMNAIKSWGDKGLDMGADVYFFLVDHKTHALDYKYADTENALIKPSRGRAKWTEINNIYSAAGALNHFLKECVENPDDYLARVHLEAFNKMDWYGRLDKHWRDELEKLGWPKTTVRHWLLWKLSQVKHFAKQRWKDRNV